MDFPTFEEQEIIDQEQFDMLVETGEDEAAEMLNELVTLFEEETSPVFEEFKSEALKGDKDNVARIAHSIAGSSGNLGGLRLSQAARFLENNIDEINDLIPPVEYIESLYKETLKTYNEKIAAL